MTGTGTTTQPEAGTPKAGRGNTGKEGMILLVVISFLTALMLLGGTVYTILAVNIRSTDLHLDRVDAFHEADAGVRYVFSQVRASEITNGLALNQAVVPINITPPAGFAFDPVTNMYRQPNKRSYTYRVTGRTGDSRTVLEAVITHYPRYMFGVFADGELSMKPGAKIYSYESATSPTPGIPTGNAAVASNTEIDGPADAVDGAVYLGEDTSGSPASYAHEASTPSDVVRLERIDPDPLGLIGGDLADTVAALALTNDNHQAVGGVHIGTALKITGNVTLTAGDYYVSEIDLGPHKTLTIDGSAGPVRIFLTGPANAGSNSGIVTSPDYPENLQIYSNASDKLYLAPQTSFTGFIYAPLAELEIKPNGDVKGALWADSMELFPYGEVYIDEDFVNSFDGGLPFQLVAWRHVID